VLSDVQGQESGVETLQRVADSKLKTPLLVVGDEGVGRKFAVMQTAKELFCREGRTPGCRCYDCTAIDNLMHSDVTLIQPEEGKDISVESIREVVDKSSSYPSSGPIRVMLVDGIDHVTTPAANAILKTLEEPPDTTRFFLLAETYDEVIPTIRSRCGRIDFKRLPESFVLEKLKLIEEDATKALVYSRMGEGSIGRAQKLWGANRLRTRDAVISLISYCISNNLAGLFAQIDELSEDLSLVLTMLEQVLYDLLVIDLDPTRLINLDAMEELVAMKKRGHDGSWIQLKSSLGAIKNRGSNIKLSFHIKAAFVQTFFTSN